MKKLVLALALATTIVSCSETTTTQTTKTTENTALKTAVDSLEQVALENKRLEEEKKASNIWTTNFYVDEFGEPTTSGYIQNTTPIAGKMSNTATQNSDINVTFLISSEKDVAFQIYEYAGRTPIKIYGNNVERYNVVVKAGEEKFKMQGINYADRISFDERDSKKLNKLLLTNEKLSFLVTEQRNKTSKYIFTIENTNDYKGTYEKFTNLAK